MTLKNEPQISDIESEQRRRWVDYWRYYLPGYDRGVPPNSTLPDLIDDLRHQITIEIPDLVDCRLPTFASDVAECVYQNLELWPMAWHCIFPHVIVQAVTGSQLCPEYCSRAAEIASEILQLKWECRPQWQSFYWCAGQGDEGVNFKNAPVHTTDFRDHPELGPDRIKLKRHTNAAHDAIIESIIHDTLTPSERRRGLSAV